MAKILKHRKNKLYYVFDNNGYFVSKTDDYKIALNLYKSYTTNSSEIDDFDEEDFDENINNEDNNYDEYTTTSKLTKEEKAAIKAAKKEERAAIKAAKKAAKKEQKAAEKEQKAAEKAAKKEEKAAKKEEKKRNKYFTEESLQNAVGDSGMQQIDSITIKPGDAFLNGETTNIQTGENINDKELTLNTININDYIDYTPNNTLSDLTKDLGNVSTNDLLSITQDGGLGLLSSKITQVTKNATQLQSVQQLTNIAAGGLGAYGMGSSIIGTVIDTPEVITTLSTAIISEVTRIISKETTQLATEYLAKHAQYALAFPQKITSYAMEQFNKEKISIADALKEMVSSAEGRADKENEKQNEKSKSEFMAKISANSKDFINKINNYVNIGTSYISMVTSYIENGPEWVTNQVDKQIDKLLEGAKKEIDNQWEKDKAAYDLKAQSLGNKLGSEMAKKFNNAIRKAQKKQTEKLNTQKVKVKAKLIAVTSKAASLLGSMMGQYIPIPDMV